MINQIKGGMAAAVCRQVSLGDQLLSRSRRKSIHATKRVPQPKPPRTAARTWLANQVERVVQPKAGKGSYNRRQAKREGQGAVEEN